MIEEVRLAKETPPPIYKDDLGWSKSRQDKMFSIYEAHATKAISDEQAIEQIKPLIVELEDAIRNHPNMTSEQNVVGASKMLQSLLYNFYSLHKLKR